MSTVGDVSGSALDQYQIKNETKTNKDLGKNEFLNLLVAQLNNQNPLEPQGNGEFIAQLAQFSQVEGIEKLNTSMGSLLTGYQSSQALQASSLVGRKVIIPSEKAVVDTSESFKASTVLPVSSSNVYVNVYDNSGALVTRVNLGEQEAGKLRASPGLSVGPESADVVTVAFSPTSAGRIAVADALASRRTLPYTLKGSAGATPLDCINIIISNKSGPALRGRNRQ